MIPDLQSSLLLGACGPQIQQQLFGPMETGSGLKFGQTAVTTGTF